MIPKLEVLLRLKQASNAAFSFLSEGDLLHPYYLLLKSWGEAALGEEYARQQRMQTERANARQREEDRETLERERAASAKGPSPTADFFSPRVGVCGLLFGSFVYMRAGLGGSSACPPSYFSCSSQTRLPKC